MEVLLRSMHAELVSRSRVKKDFPSLKAGVCCLYWVTMGKNFLIALQNTAIQEVLRKVGSFQREGGFYWLFYKVQACTCPHR